MARRQDHIVLLTFFLWIYVFTFVQSNTTVAPTCPDGKYEPPACSSTCGNCKNNVVCDKTNGNCPSGCAPGWKPSDSKCKTQCSSGTYGQDCTASCSAQCTDTCNPVNGDCKCNPGYKPPLCTAACDNGKYGQNCTGNCGHCTGGVACDKRTGQCATCMPGWIHPFCQTACAGNTYGQDCSQTCGNCNGGAACNKQTGQCSTCAAGYQMPMCKDRCENGTYGVDCGNSCGQCVDVCNKENGHCTCRPGYQPSLCQIKCGSGNYGQDCRETCGDCVDGTTTCDHVNGSCPRCMDNRQMPLCKDCIPGHWGPTCGQLCGQCGGDGACDRITGGCLQQVCLDGYLLPKCDKKCSPGTYGPNCSKTCGHCRAGTACRHDNGFCEADCEEDYEGVLCQKSSKDLTAAVVGSIFGAAVIIAATIVAVMCYFKRWKGQTKKETVSKTALSTFDESPSVHGEQPPSPDGGTYQNVDLKPVESSSHHRHTTPPNYDKVDMSKRENHLYDKHLVSPATGTSGADPIYQNSDITKSKGKKGKKLDKTGLVKIDNTANLYGNVEIS